MPSCICHLSARRYTQTHWAARAHAHGIIKSVNSLAQSERNNYCNKCVLDYCLYVHIKSALRLINGMYTWIGIAQRQIFLIRPPSPSHRPLQLSSRAELWRKTFSQPHSESRRKRKQNTKTGIHVKHKFTMEKFRSLFLRRFFDFFFFLCFYEP